MRKTTKSFDILISLSALRNYFDVQKNYLKICI